MARRMGMILIAVFFGGCIGAGVEWKLARMQRDRELESMVFVSQLDTTALCISTLRLMDDNRSDAALSMLRARLASSLAVAHGMEFSPLPDGVAIPNLIEAIRRARDYAVETGMAPEVAAHADEVLKRL